MLGYAVQSAQRAEAIPRIRNTDVYLRAEGGKGGVRQPKRATSERTLGWYRVLGAFGVVGAYGVAVERGRSRARASPVLFSYPLPY